MALWAGSDFVKWKGLNALPQCLLSSPFTSFSFTCMSLVAPNWNTAPQQNGTCTRQCKGAHSHNIEPWKNTQTFDIPNEKRVSNLLVIFLCLVWKVNFYLKPQPQTRHVTHSCLVRKDPLSWTENSQEWIMKLNKGNQAKDHHQSQSQSNEHVSNYHYGIFCVCVWQNFFFAPENSQYIR